MASFSTTYHLHRQIQGKEKLDFKYTNLAMTEKPLLNGEYLFMTGLILA